jgi:hypothetical protein
MTKRSFVLAAVAALLLSALPALAANPNFSGEWKMNAAKSDWGPMPTAPDKMIRKIEQTEDTISITTTQAGPQGERTTSTTWKTDGSEQTVKMGNAEVKGTAKFENGALVIQSKREVQGMEIGQKETWRLSEDGKVTTVTNQLSTPQGDFEIKIVLEKQ